MGFSKGTNTVFIEEPSMMRLKYSLTGRYAKKKKKF